MTELNAFIHITVVTHYLQAHDYASLHYGCKHSWDST